MWLAPAASTVLLDDTPPSVTFTIDGINGTNGWYRGSTGGNFVVVHWSVNDPDSPISSTSGCEPAVGAVESYLSPNEAEAELPAWSVQVAFSAAFALSPVL